MSVLAKIGRKLFMPISGLGKFKNGRRVFRGKTSFVSIVL